MEEQPRPWSLLGTVLGVLAGLALVQLGTAVCGIFIGPIREDLFEQYYGAYYRWALVLGAALGGFLGFWIGSSYDEDLNGS
jgi:hypothetical protein